MLTEANLEAHDFRLDYAKELLAAMAYRRGKAALAEDNEALRAKVAEMTAANLELQKTVSDQAHRIEQMQAGVMDMKPIWDNHLVIYGKNYCDEDRKGKGSLHEFLLDLRGELMEADEQIDWLYEAYEEGECRNERLNERNGKLREKVAALKKENEALKVRVPIVPTPMSKIHALEKNITAEMHKIDAMIERADRLIAEHPTAKRQKVSESN